MNRQAASQDDWSTGLPTSWLGRPFFFFPEIDSTNRYLQDHAAELPHGAVALTDFQSIGRGRLNRRWVTPPGEAVLMSVLLKPDWPAARLPWLAMMAGLAAAAALQTASRLDIRLKWPNDCIVPTESGRSWRKIAGILLEAAPSGGWVIGLGLNINQEPASLPAGEPPAASLRSLAGRTFDRREIVHLLLADLEAWVERGDRGESPLPAWRQALQTLGQRVTVQPLEGQPAWIGRAVDVDESGRLLVELDSGQVRPVTAGDVSLRPGLFPGTNAPSP